MDVHMNEMEYAALLDFIAQFEKKNPKIQIDVTNVAPAKGQTYYDTLKLHAQLGKMADLTMMDSNWVEEFAALGYLNDLDDHYIQVPAENYVASLLAPLKWNGFYWGVPLDFDPYVLVYQNKMVAQVGFHEPAGNLLKWQIQIDKLNAIKNRKFESLYVNADDPYQLLVLDADILQKAIKPQGTNSQQLEVRIPRSVDPEQLWGDFHAGRWLFMITPLSEALHHQSKDVPVTITTIPQQPTVVNNEGLLFEGRSMVMSANTPYRKDALKWIQFISDKHELALWYASTNQLPSMIASYQSTKIQTYVPRIILDRLDKPVHSLAKPDFPTKVGHLTNTIEQVWAGKQSISTLVNELDSLRVKK
jgi:arabinogalactan oligomer/maltooligosaccharide transport system substrate-binding protein